MVEAVEAVCWPRAQEVSAWAMALVVVTKEQRKGKRLGHEYLVTEPVRQCLEKLIALQAELRPALHLPPEMVPPLLWGRCGVVKGRVLCEHTVFTAGRLPPCRWCAGQAGGLLAAQ